MYTIEYILKKAKDNDFNIDELNLISKAYKLCEEKLTGQMRDNNETELSHVLTVATIITDLNADSTTIIAALLHNILDCSNISFEMIKSSFGDNVFSIIENLYKLNKVKLTDYSESSSIYLRKILVGLSEDVRVLIIKLADRLHDMRTAYALPSDERKKLANDTQQVLIPIAHRLGINIIKSELEDLCLKYLKPNIYEEILEQLNGTKGGLQNSLDEMKSAISEILAEHGIKFEIKGRVKSVSSIYDKLSKGRKWNDIYDILAMRLIVPSENDCYLAVGLIHAKYRPIPKRFKDYIAMPKSNMYQSLHTSIFGIDGHIFEIQLRTADMDEIAEHGIASHWSYKEHGTKVIKNLMEQKLEIFRNTIQLSQGENNDEIFAKNMEEEILSNLIYVYTPKGDVMELPQGSTPIDFAYRIHSDIGDKTIGAIVNEIIVPLNYELQDGDIIKINTSNTSKPNISWLDFVKTTQARNKIKSYFSKKDRVDYIEQGKSLLEKEIKHQKLNISDTLTDKNINKILKDLKMLHYDDLLLSIGALRYTPSYIINLIYDDKKSVLDVMLDRVNHNEDQTKINYKNEIIVAGSDNILVSIAKCCNPIPGDKIIGYVTKGEGVSVHKEDCLNMKNITNRLIDVEWSKNNADKQFFSKLIIKTNSLKNEVLQIVTRASVRNISINSINEFVSDISIDYELSVKVKNKDELELFVAELYNLDFIMEVTRL